MSKDGVCQDDVGVNNHPCKRFSDWLLKVEVALWKLSRDVSIKYGCPVEMTSLVVVHAAGFP